MTHAEDTEEVDATDVIAARGETLAAYAATVESAPGATVMPDALATETGGERTLALLTRVASQQEPRLVVDDEVLGRGGMSVVYLGTQATLGRKVAVKSPREDGSAAHSRVLLREAWITGQLEHPNVMPVYDLAVDDGRPRVVLKRIEGVEWADLISDPEDVRRRFGVSDVRSWHLGTFLQVCNAIHFAHSKGIIHRDIKPSNVMIGAFGEVYVTDWGIAVSNDPQTPAAYDPAALAGTPLYIAPESLLGKPVSPATDVYLLGGLLFELLTGKPAREPGALLALIAQAVTEAPPEFPESVPAELAAICSRCLRLAPEDRFADAEVLRRALETYLERAESLALSDAAGQDLERLVREAEAMALSPDEHPADLYDLFGACRFGFHAALRAWPDNEEARLGIERAVRAMVALEISRGNAASAQTLLGELEAPPAELREQVEAAVAEEAAHRKETERLAALEADLDPELGRSGRFLAAVLLTPPILAAPLTRMDPEAADPTFALRLAIPLVQLAILLALFTWKRAELLANLYNRRLFQATIMVFLGQAVLVVGHYLGGIAMALSNVQNYAIVAMGLTTLAIFVDRRLSLVAAAYTGVYLITSAYPEHRHLYAFAGNLLLCGTLLYIWRPRRRGNRPA